MLLLIALTRSCPARLSCDNGSCTITETVELKEVTAVFERTIDHINYLTIVDEYGNEHHGLVDRLIALHRLCLDKLPCFADNSPLMKIANTFSRL